MKSGSLNYESPRIEILEIETEQCFAVSNTDMNTNEWGWGN